MKKILLITVVLILFLFSAGAQVSAYKPGEKVRYTVHYGFITGGEATLELNNDTLSGKQLWHSRLTGKTLGIVDLLFKVLDIYESYMDPVTELPVRSIRNISEGNYKRYNVEIGRASCRERV